MKKAYGYIRNLCFVLAFCLLICALPMSATELGSTDESPVESAPKTVKVVFAIEDIPQGAKIIDRVLEVREVLAENLPDNTIEDIDELIYKYAARDIYAGEYVYKDQCSAGMVPKQNSEALVKPISQCKKDYLVVTDYVKANTGLEIEYYIQQLIDENPHSTIYFPAGEYVFGSPIATPADAQYSVSILLDDGAVIKASDNWKANGEWDALICLGGTHFRNDIQTVGSYYLLQGGVLDANNKTNGVSIEGGRESVVRNLCIKNAKIGVNARKATNNTSADCDFEDITIIGSGKLGSVGINNISADNTFTNIRIYDMQVGISGNRGGHIKNIYVINTQPEKMYSGTVGIIGTGTFVSNCYVENYETAYRNPIGELWDCTAAWTSDVCKKQIAFERTTGKKGNNCLTGCVAIFRDVEGAKIAFSSGEFTEHGATIGIAFDESLVTDDSYKALTGDNKITWCE